MAETGYNLNQTGAEVQDAIDRIINLDLATSSEDGLMSAGDKAKLDALVRASVVGHTLVFAPGGTVQNHTLIL